MISVAMATYNGEKYIRQQIESILQQTYNVDELVIYDDCSTDDTVKIIEEIKNTYIGNVCIKLHINSRNSGYISNFYNAISATTGEYIFLADQDDVWHKDKVKSVIHFMKKNNCKAVCTNFDIIDGNGQRIRERSNYRFNRYINKTVKPYIRVSFHTLAYGNIAQGCTYCFDKEVKELYLKIKSNALIHDHQILLIASLVGSVYFLNERLIDYRLHSDNNLGFEKIDDKIVVKKKITNRKPFMVQFIDDVDRVVRVKHKYYYYAIFYLRIPYFCSVIKKLRMKR